GECRRLTGIAEPGPGTGSGGSGLSAFATQEPVDQPSDGPGHGTDGCAGDEAGPRGEEAHYEVRQPGIEVREVPAEAGRGTVALCGPEDQMPCGQENSVEHAEVNRVRKGCGTLAHRVTMIQTRSGPKTKRALVAVPSLMMSRSWRTTRGAASGARPMRAISGSPSRRADRPGRSVWSAALETRGLSCAENEFRPQR